MRTGRQCRILQMKSEKKIRNIGVRSLLWLRVLSSLTMIRNGNPAYGYMDGTSMACPHVSGVAALGLSYAVQQRRHFKASEFITLMKESVKPVDDYYVRQKQRLTIIIISLQQLHPCK